MMNDRNNRHREGGRNGPQPYRKFQRPPGQQAGFRPAGSSDGLSSGMQAAHTLKDVPICLNGFKALFRDCKNSSYEISVQTTKYPSGCFVTVKKLNNLGEFENLDVLCAYLFGDTEQDAWKEAADELVSQYPIYHTAPHRVPVSKHSLPFLESHSIKKLEQPTEAFPDAMYYCHLCHYHIASVKSARKHLDGDHMKEEKKMQSRLDFLERCKDLPSEFFIALERKINEFIPDVSEDDANILLAELSSAQNILQNIFDVALGEDYQCVLEPFGPILHRCSNNESPWKFSLRCENIPPIDTMQKLRILSEAIYSYQEKSGLKPDASFSSAFTPTIIGSLEGRKFLIVYKGIAQLSLSTLVNQYTYGRPLVTRLMRLVRHWSKVCGLDRSDTSRPGLAHHAFDVMVIHFLQRCKYLPVLHEILDVETPPKSEHDYGFRANPINSSPEEIHSQSSSFELEPLPSVGELFVKFLAHYCEKREDVVQITSSRAVSKYETRWMRKFFQIVDPFRSDNLVIFSKSFQPYFFNCFVATLVYLVVPRNSVGPIAEVKLFQMDITRKNKCKNSSNANGVEQEPAPDGNNSLMDQTIDMSHEAYSYVINKGADILRTPETIHEKELSMTSSTRVRRRRYKKQPNNEPDDVMQSVDDLNAEEADARYLRNITSVMQIHGKLVSDMSSADYNLQGENGQSPYCAHFLRKHSVSQPHSDTDVIKACMSAGIYTGDTSFEVDKPNPEGSETDLPVEHLSIREKSDIHMHKGYMISKCEADGVYNPSHSTTSQNANVADIQIDSSVNDKEVLYELNINSPSHQKDLYRASPQAAINEDKINESEFGIPQLPRERDSEKLIDELSCDDGEMKQNAQAESTKDHVEDETVVPGNICYEEFYVECDFEGTIENLIVSRCVNWTVDDFLFDFETKENFTRGLIPDFKCTYCDTWDHAPDDCPSLQIIPIAKYGSDLPESELEDLCKLIERNYLNKQVTRKHIATADTFVQKLLEQLKEKCHNSVDEAFWAETRLTIFGSLRNGFGVNSSDVDLCLRFAEDYSHEENSSSEIMRQLWIPLRSIGCRHDNIQIILNCKVPIVKFVWWPKNEPKCKIDGDISYYNDLAIVNTDLLSEYSNWGDVIDSNGKRKPRVKQLGLWIKMWSKKCDIGDASSGSLSSYAYTLLMIHYLQNLSDPVLPRLQEQFRGNTYKPRIIDGWDTYFFKDENGNKRKNWSKNKMNVAELFIGFLDYYSQFDFANTVIQIRQKQPVTKFEKEWNNRVIAIEDPFDLNHNLGRGVSTRMAIYIQNTFRRSRNVFRSSQVHKKFVEDRNLVQGTEVTMVSELCPLLEEALLKSCVGDQAAPKDRVCTNCKQSGHRHMQCPRLNRKKFNQNGNDMRRRYNPGFSNGNQGQTPARDSANDVNSRWRDSGKVNEGFSGNRALRKDNGRNKQRFNNENATMR